MPSSSSSILIVDPCGMTRQCIKVLLYAKKYSVHTVETMNEAIDFIESNRPSIIIHELEFTDGNAKELIARVDKLPLNTPTMSLLLTHVEDAANHPSAPEVSLNQVLIKRTFTINNLYAKIELLLDALSYENSAQTVQPGSSPDESVSVSMPAPEAELDPEPSTDQTTEQECEPEAKTFSTVSATAEQATSEFLPDSERTNEPPPRMQIVTKAQIANDDENKIRVKVPPARTAQLRETLCNRAKPLMDCEEVMRYVRKFANQQSMSPTAKEVIELCGSEDATLEDIAESIETDPAIAEKVIRIANSSAFVRGEPATSAADAVRRLGMKQICQCVLNIEIMDNFANMSNGVIKPRRFWEHSIAVATACAFIARDARMMPPDLAYTLGLLHDVGRIVLSQALSEQYRKVIDYAREKELPVDPVERQMLSKDHAQIIQPVLEHWNMTSELIEPIMHHHKQLNEIKEECPKWYKRVATLSLADRLVHAMNIGCSGNPTIYPTEAYFEALDIDPERIEKIMEDLPDAVADMRSIMLTGISGNKRERKQTITVTLRPNYVTQHGTKDAIQYWIDSNAAKTTVDLRSGPNVHIVRLRTHQDVIDATKCILSVENEYEHENMPILVLTDSDSLGMPENITDTRSVRMITVPFTFNEFKQSIESFPELANDEQSVCKSA